MKPGSSVKIKSLLELFGVLPENERIIIDVLRQIIIENLPPGSKEKIAFNVPFFYRKRGICIIWPSSIRGGGIRSGVLLGFWHGNKLTDPDKYLVHGSNKQVFYKIYHSPEDINEKAIQKLLTEAIQLDDGGSPKK